ncbi:hypothetical protein HHX48_03460 [Salinimonas sp. HHU 13199]|uniref:Uncharacterized protein n=1 Tax=Salinimonas profundi TaxID=2729140 RepID=A0ABR8LEU1_9ALTE|nr:hypothetical protein [Salinimonas profundi]MBD3584792.1 hypothetical protein [Salinimonas profundi]
MNHVLHVTYKNQVLSLKLAFVLFPIVMLMAGLALGMLFSSNLTFSSPLSLVSVIAPGVSAVIALGYGFTYYFKKIDRLTQKR